MLTIIILAILFILISWYIIKKRLSPFDNVFVTLIFMGIALNLVGTLIIATVNVPKEESEILSKYSLLTFEYNKRVTTEVYIETMLIFNRDALKINATIREAKVNRENLFTNVFYSKKVSELEYLPLYK